MKPFIYFLALVVVSCSGDMQHEPSGSFEKADLRSESEAYFLMNLRYGDTTLSLNARPNFAIPNPTPEYVSGKQDGSLYLTKPDIGTNMFADDVYLYLLMTLDTLGPKRILAQNRQDSGLEWEQEFTRGITYRFMTYGEVMSGGELHTRSKEKQGFIEKISPVIAPQTCENCLNSAYVWRKDSTLYEPEGEGAGCYYTIKRSAKDFIVMTWQCGC